jgi:hypothetical protein
LEKDVQCTLILESISEINARLRILDETNARLEAAVERQLELLEFLATNQALLLVALQTQMVCATPAKSAERKTQDGSQVVNLQGHEIVEGENHYSKETHPALFRVVELLEQDEQARKLSVRQLAHETGVSKSWCAIAKRHMLREESVH